MLKYKGITLGLLLVITLIIGVRWIKHASFRPIEVVAFSDKLHYVDPLEIKTAVRPYIQQGFFGLQLGKLREELIRVPWIANASVQRCWPDTIKIKIIERQPLATWQDKGVVDTEGKLFFPVSLANLDGLPQFIGEQEQVDSMLDMYLKLLSSLKPIGLSIKRLEIMPDQGWRAMLDNGVTVILGQVELEERVARFVLAYDKILGADLKPKVQVIDLRYTNGLTVG